ncbi:SAM-dependent methyltransferase [Caballeronia grimmiae]|uniref:hypothetical protein n=1 Tax=Caballeronia grimmiae TaxID=1071679 RepID=UPI0038B90BF8
MNHIVKKEGCVPKPKVLHVIGYGINFDADRSVLVDQHVDQCEVLFALESDVSHLPHSVAGTELVNLLPLYKQGRNRGVVYEAVAERVMDSFQSFSQVGLMVEGSPFFLDSICGLLERKAIDQEIQVIYVDGRSSLDLIIQTLRIPLTWGIGVHLANDLCFGNRVMDPEAVNILFQPGNVGSDRVQMHDVERRGVILLRETLLRFYAPETRWLLVNLGQSARHPTRVAWDSLDHLDQFTQLMHSGTLLVSKNWQPGSLEGRGQ